MKKIDLTCSSSILPPLQLAEAGWRAQYEGTKDHCIHGPSCKNAPNCTIGSRLTHIHLLSGGILPLLSLLEVTLSRNASRLELPRDARMLRVVRVQLEGGQRIIGVRYPLPLINEVEMMLGTLGQAQANETNEAKEEASDSYLPLVSKDLLVEPETPINRKALSRALNPPMTIQHFFQLKPPASSSTCVDGFQTQVPLGTALRPSGRLAPGTGKRPTVAGQSNKQKKLEFRVTKPTTPQTPIVIDDKCDYVCTEDQKQLIQQQVGTVQDLLTTPQPKRCKETSGTNPTRVGITTVCPVCSKELVLLSNLALNQHLDVCLGLRKSPPSLA